MAWLLPGQRAFGLPGTPRDFFHAPPLTSVPMSRRLETTRNQRLRSAVPFGIGQTKPTHFRDMLRIAC